MTMLIARRALTFAIVAVLGVPAGAAATTLDDLAQDGRFDVFLAAARVSGVDEVLRASEEARTIFVPTDRAFARLPDDLVRRLGSPAGAAALERLLSGHVVPGRRLPSDGLPERMDTLSGATLRVDLVEDGVVVFVDGAEGGGARIVEGDISSGDATLAHAVDAVLLPGGAAGRTKPSVAAEDRERRGRGFVEAIEAADTDRTAGSLFEDEERDFGADQAGERDEPARFAADEMMIVNLGGETGSPGLAEAARVVTLPEEARRIVARLRQPGEEPDAGSPRARPAGDRRDTGAERSRADDADRREGAAVPRQMAAAEGTSGPAPDDERRLDLTSETISLSDLLGRAVRDPQGERIGEVGDVTLSLATLRAEEIVLEIDAGLLGLFDRTSRVAPDAISIDPLDGAVIVDRGAIEGGDE